MHGVEDGVIVAVANEGWIHTLENGEWSSFQHSSMTNFNDVWVQAPDDIWVVGDGGIVLRYDGTSWQSAEANISGDVSLQHIWGRENERWILSEDAIYWYGEEGREPTAPMGAVEDLPVVNDAFVRVFNASDTPRQFCVNGLPFGDTPVPVGAALGYGIVAPATINFGTADDASACAATADMPDADQAVLSNNTYTFVATPEGKSSLVFLDDRSTELDPMNPIQLRLVNATDAVEGLELCRETTPVIPDTSAFSVSSFASLSAGDADMPVAYSLRETGSDDCTGTFLGQFGLNLPAQTTITFFGLSSGDASAPVSLFACVDVFQGEAPQSADCVVVELMAEGMMMTEP